MNTVASSRLRLHQFEDLLREYNLRSVRHSQRQQRSEDAYQ